MLEPLLGGLFLFLSRCKAGEEVVTLACASTLQGNEQRCFVQQLLLANAADFRFTLPQLLPLFPQPKSVEATERLEDRFSNWWWLPLHHHYRLERKKVLALKVTQTSDLVEPQRQCWIFPSCCDRDCKVKWDTGIRSSVGLDTPLSCLPFVKGSQNIPSLALIINCKLNRYETCFQVVCLE